MNQELKRLVLVSLLPTFADFIEDLNEDKAFRTEMKMATQNLIGQIRKLDERIMKNASAETSEQQINIQIAFRQWLKSAQNTVED
jgi:head-tail adaptor